MNEKQVWLKDGKLQVYTNHWEEVTEPVPPTPVVHVTGVTLDQDSASLEPEETLQLTATVTPSDATDKSVTWTSSDEAVATVSTTGLVTAVADGDATITVKTNDGNYTATCAVAVSSYVPEVTGVALSSFDPQTPATIYTGRSMGSGIQVTPYTASNVHVTITSSDPEVVQVGEITYDPEPSEWSVGYVTLIGVATGTATVTVTSQDDPTVSATYSFVVEQNVPVTAISNLSNNTANVLNIEAQTQIATVDYTPTNAVVPNWDVSLRAKEGETNIGRGYTVSTDTPGTLAIMFGVDTQTAQAGDSAVYEVYLTNDPSFTPLEITLTVIQGVESIANLDETALSITEGSTDTSKTFTYLPTNGDISSIEVRSINQSVATAEIVKDSDGNAHVSVTGVSAGSGAIDLYIGETKVGSFDVTVTEVPLVSSYSTWSGYNSMDIRNELQSMHIELMSPHGVQQVVTQGATEVSHSYIAGGSADLMSGGMEQCIVCVLCASDGTILGVQYRTQTELGSDYTALSSAFNTPSNMTDALWNEMMGWFALNLTVSTAGGTITISDGTESITVDYNTYNMRYNADYYTETSDTSSEKATLLDNGWLTDGTYTYSLQSQEATDWEGVISSLKTKGIVNATITHDAVAGEITIANGQWSMTIADKNVGASVVYEDGDTLDETNGGKYFQWGNNYGFPFTGSVTTSSTQVDASTYGPNNPYSDSTFILGSASTSWMLSPNNDLWGETTNTDIARQGPCGTGYHIPSASELQALFDFFTAIRPTAHTATDFANEFKIPFPGIRNPQDGDILQQGNQGYYWTTTPVSGVYAKDMFTRPNNTNNPSITSGSQSYAYSIRAFKNASS